MKKELRKSDRLEKRREAVMERILSREALRNGVPGRAVNKIRRRNSSQPKSCLKDL
jgi:hypothetical protein